MMHVESQNNVIYKVVTQTNINIVISVGDSDDDSVGDRSGVIVCCSVNGVAID